MVVGLEKCLQLVIIYTEVIVPKFDLKGKEEKRKLDKSESLIACME